MFQAIQLFFSVPKSTHSLSQSFAFKPKSLGLKSSEHLSGLQCCILACGTEEQWSIKIEQGHLVGDIRRIFQKGNKISLVTAEKFIGSALGKQTTFNITGSATLGHNGVRSALHMDSHLATFHTEIMYS